MKKMNQRRKKARNKVKKPSWRWKLALIIGSSIWGQLPSMLSLDFLQVSASCLENFWLRETSWKFILPNSLQGVLRAELMYLTSTISIGRPVWHNLPSSISRCALWVTSNEYLKSGLFSEQKILSLIVICASLWASTWKWLLRSTISKFSSSLVNFSHLSLKICTKGLPGNWRPLMSSLNSNPSSVSTQL